MDIIPWNKKLLTRSVNYHGADFLSNIMSRHEEAVLNLDPNAITFRRFKERREILNRHIPHNEEFITFIYDKAMRIFKTTVKDYNSEMKDMQVFKDIQSCLPPIECCMDVHPKICFDMFFRDVEKDDLLFGYIDDCPSEKIYSMKILSTITPKHRYLKESNVMAFMREEETRAEPGCREPNGRWKKDTPIIAQVLVVEKIGDSTAILVGTKESRTAKNDGGKIVLGKASNDIVSPSILKMIAKKLPPYQKCLENVGTFQSSHLWKKSLENLANHFALDLNSRSTLMKIDTVPGSPAPEYQYKLAQCCVAEGVSYYKEGENEKAMEALEAALSLDKSHVNALVAKGTLLANLGRIEEALKDFELVLQLNPEHQNARYYACESLIQLAERFVEKGQISEAEEKYQQCLGINPENVAARDGLHKIGRPAVPEKRKITPLNVLYRNLPELGEPPTKKQYTGSSTSYTPPRIDHLRDNSPITSTGHLVDAPANLNPYLPNSNQVQDLRELIVNKKQRDASFSTDSTFGQPPQDGGRGSSRSPLNSHNYMTDVGSSGGPNVEALLNDPNLMSKATQLIADPNIQKLLSNVKNVHGGNGNGIGNGDGGSQGSFAAAVKDSFTKAWAPKASAPKASAPKDSAQKASTPNTQTQLTVGNMDAGICRGGTRELHRSSLVEDEKICDQYLKGNCKFGASGRKCSKTHPRYCKTYLKKGKCPNGWLFCAKGPHPLVCKNSLTHGICNFKGCNYLHLNKTKDRTKSPSKLGSVGFIMNSVKRKLDIKVNDDGPPKSFRIRKKKPLHRHYWRKLWQLKMARVEIRAMKEKEL